MTSTTDNDVASGVENARVKTVLVDLGLGSLMAAAIGFWTLDRGPLDVDPRIPLALLSDAWSAGLPATIGVLLVAGQIVQSAGARSTRADGGLGIGRVPAELCGLASVGLVAFGWISLFGAGSGHHSGSAGWPLVAGLPLAVMLSYVSGDRRRPLGNGRDPELAERRVVAGERWGLLNASGEARGSRRPLRLAALVGAVPGAVAITLAMVIEVRAAVLGHLGDAAQIVIDGAGLGTLVAAVHLLCASMAVLAVIRGRMVMAAVFVLMALGFDGLFVHMAVGGETQVEWATALLACDAVIFAAFTLDVAPRALGRVDPIIDCGVGRVAAWSLLREIEQCRVGRRPNRGWFRWAIGEPLGN